ncbi:hypothetical protein ZWY2020_004180 [Hordeum vulgare]|uniref:NAC domain-containing protein n=1 Tax=Hordeum vulgare subsp. vulgare TaxID=112509 RepID=A0A8I6XP59_HORVV|nr:hypothetical protein ZWY2020_004180 [Hordeum vulgare]
MVAYARRSRAPGRPALAIEAHPCEQDLITAYLGGRLTSGDMSWEFIHEGDVYSAHPTDLTEQYAAAVTSNGDKAWYFFTSVRAKGGGRRARTVDSQEGCWHSEAGSKPVVSAQNHRGSLVGHRQNFSFVTKEDGVRVRSGWLMVELGLHGDGRDQVTLCKVYFSPRAAKNDSDETPAASSSARKRKADADSPAPSRQCRRRRRRREMKQEDHPVEKQEVKAGEEEGLVEENSPDETEVGDPNGLFWWPRNKEKLRLAAGISEEDFYGTPSAPASERVFRLDWPPAAAPSSPVVPIKDLPVVMWLTYEELYNLPEVREFLSPTKLLEEMRSSVKQHE